MEHEKSLTNARALRMANIIIGSGWALMCVVQIVAALSEGNTKTGGFLLIVQRTLLANAPFALYCWLQFRTFMKLEVELLTIRFVVLKLFFASVLYFVPLIFFEASINPIILGASPWSSWPSHIAAYPALFWTFDYLVFAGCFAAVLAPRLWIGHRQSEAIKELTLRENLKLKLALQQQQLKVLQLQLEPHFLFNSLNAISALVRSDDKPNALTAISALSKLLRYAVKNSDGSSSTVREELTVVGDYLSLQGMRFGDRLKFKVDEVSDEISDVKIPALVLQPLVENAIRHDLECHTDSCEIEVSLSETVGAIEVCVSNTSNHFAIPNQGSGVGLKNLRERIGLLYNGSAQLRTTRSEGRFTAALILPKEFPDEHNHTNAGN